MSVRTLGRVITEGVSNSELAARLVLIAIANYADDRGFGYAKTLTLAEGANIDRSTAWRKLLSLVEIGEIRMFTRGHYEAPAFAITIVEHPLSTTEIVERLWSTDRQAVWHERLPGEQTLPFTRSLHPATISEDHRDIPSDDEPQAPDQALHPSEEWENRENRHNHSDGEIVAERNDPLQDAPEIVAGRNRSSRLRNVVQNSLKTNPSTTTTTTGSPPDGERGGGGGEPEGLEAVGIARRWCEITDKAWTGPVKARYSTQVAEFLAATGVADVSDEFMARAADQGIIEPSGWGFLTGSNPGPASVLPDCARCGNHRLLGVLADGTTTAYDDPEGVALVPCDTCRIEAVR
ncbi:MAG TPA: hypothetical protein VJA46_06835 [Acidimicrobiia bacterium]|nr:hypothetical protein [Acidimicrobiia bacterium]